MPKAVSIAIPSASTRAIEQWGARKRRGNASLGELWDIYGNPTSMTAQIAARQASQQQVRQGANPGASLGWLNAAAWQAASDAQNATPAGTSRPFGLPFQDATAKPGETPVPTFGQAFGASLLNFGNLFAMSWLDRERAKIERKNVVSQPPAPQQQQASILGLDPTTLLLVAGAGVVVFMFSTRGKSKKR